MSIERQNELFPNNMEHRAKERLKTHRAPTPEEEKLLDEKLNEEHNALMHQKFLVEGVLKQLVFKRKDVHAAEKGLVKNITQKWMQKHDIGTDVAKITMSRGPYFGVSKPLRKPFRLG